MRPLISILLLFLPLAVCGQRKQAYLNRLFYRQYITEMHNNDNCYYFLAEPKTPAIHNVQEVFPHHFRRARIYLVTFYDKERYCHHCPLYYPVLYAIDKRSRRLISFATDSSFVAFVNNSRKPVSHLDMAYMYLCLYAKVSQCGEMASPDHYDAALTNNSSFADTGALSIFFAPIPGTLESRTDGGPHKGQYTACPFNKHENNVDGKYVSLSAACKQMATSSADSIILYSYKFQMNADNQRHLFRFDTSGKLNSIVTETLQ